MIEREPTPSFESVPRPVRVFMAIGDRALNLLDRVQKNPGPVENLEEISARHDAMVADVDAMLARIAEALPTEDC